jgi:prophage regulatory protein
MRILRYQQLKSEKGITFSREHIRRLELAGRFPKRVRLAEGGDHYGYVEDEIDAYLAKRIAARDASRAAQSTDKECVNDS